MYSLKNCMERDMMCWVLIEQINAKREMYLLTLVSLQIDLSCVTLCMCVLCMTILTYAWSCITHVRIINFPFMQTPVFLTENTYIVETD